MKKHSDDYSAKIDLWLENITVYPLPRIIGLPHFSPQKFDSYEEMNNWKKKYLEEIASLGGVTWTK